MPQTPQDVLALAQDSAARIVDLRFCDLPGLMQHFSIPVEELTEEGIASGYGFDGSSIRGFQAIHESDMLLMPDPTTAVMDPFREVPTLQMHCFVTDPLTRESYSRDPRHIASKAEAHLRATGVAEVSYWGPELEFYIFDGARFDQNQHEGYYHIESVEGVWASGHPGSRGYRPRYKEGYFPVPPMDQHQDLRSEMALTVQAHRGRPSPLASSQRPTPRRPRPCRRRVRGRQTRRAPRANHPFRSRLKYLHPQVLTIAPPRRCFVYHFIDFPAYRFRAGAHHRVGSDYRRTNMPGLGPRRPGRAKATWPEPTLTRPARWRQPPPPPAAPPDGSVRARPPARGCAWLLFPKRPASPAREQPRERRPAQSRPASETACCVRRACPARRRYVAVLAPPG